ncbi:hypothetical protein RFI_22389 [Reticulomyxa filosa]|uniref:Uncharacterized protein n=1 Tax=Reticulomyxa filosa TaxID=46433 RepID=X6MMB5_RETFI|nr:hypothetical protein RFI_22389 [Reticulomyxa filosa]|eukprot:ETO14979.1 hypothetical protein RFI_22389 [Reticulomyxa filosa]
MKIRVKMSTQRPTYKYKRARRAMQTKNRVQTKKNECSNVQSRGKREIFCNRCLFNIIMHTYFLLKWEYTTFFLYKLCVCNVAPSNITTNEIVLDYSNLREINGGRLLDIFDTKKDSMINFDLFIIGFARVIKEIFIFSFSQ